MNDLNTNDQKKEEFLKTTIKHLLSEFKPHEQRELLNQINNEIVSHYETILDEREKVAIIAKENLEIYLDNQAKILVS